MKVYLALDSFRCSHPIKILFTTESIKEFFFGQELVIGVGYEKLLCSLL